MKNAALLVLASLPIVACSLSSGSQDAAERVARAESPVINGKLSDASQNAVVLLMFFDGRTGGGCTGTLLSPSLLLTARHCVSDTDEGVACTSKGEALGGSGAINATHAANTLYVFTGTKRPNFQAGEVSSAARGKKVIGVPGANVLCNADFALVLLDKPITNMPIAPIRLASGPKLGEQITAVGWGVTEKTPEPSQRMQREGIAVEQVGPVDEGGQGIGDKEFEVGESICSGDSGGPALASKTGAVIGVVSRGGNGQRGSQQDPAAGCIDASNIYTQVAPFADLIRSAAASVNEEVWEEGGPDPRKKKNGEACAADDECRGALCNAGVCTQSCADSACPDGFVCSATDPKVCVVPGSASDPSATPGTTTTTVGCALSASPASSSGSALALGALGAAALVAARRRHRARAS